MSLHHGSERWNKFAETYRQRIMASSNSNMAKHLLHLLSRANDYLPYSMATSILDNGCGSGLVTERLIQHYALSIPANCALQCADFSESMTKQVEAHKAEILDSKETSEAERICWEKVQTSVQNATALELSEASQSHILTNMVYFLTPDPSACLEESFRVLKPSGVLATSGLADSEWGEALDAGQQAVRPDCTRGKLNIPAEWKDEDLLKCELEKAGFKDVTVDRVEMVVGFESYKGQINMMSEMPHVKRLTEELSAKEYERWEMAVEAKMKEYAPREPGHLKGSVLVAVGRK